jgi:hypothetical protein
VRLHARPTVAFHDPVKEGAWAISLHGSMTAADVYVEDRFVLTAVSVYAPWEIAAGRGYADASTHRMLSDLSALVAFPQHRLVVAGDWNILRGYGENGSTYWKARYDTVFERAEALGLRSVGPQYPAGRQAEPWPDELPLDSRCVPTFHHNRQTPATATRQLDLCSSRRQSPMLSTCVRSTTSVIGDPATTAGSSSTSTSDSHKRITRHTRAVRCGW